MSAMFRRSSHFHGGLLRYSLHQWRSFFTPSSSPSPRLPSHHHLPLLNTMNFRSEERMCFGLYQRYLCTAGKSSGATSEILETRSSSDSNSGDGGGSKQSGDAGKSVRGSPVSWISLILLLVTGAGIVVYYDKEKKRHIEGT